MKVRDNYKIISNDKIAGNEIYEMVIDCGKVDAKPGQFVNVYLNGVLLPRPISIADYEEEAGVLHLIYRVVGEGTNIMKEMKENDEITLMIGLGNGFDLDASKKPLVIGGGLGVAPLYYLTKKLREQHKNPKVLLGFNNHKDAFFVDKIELFLLLNRALDSESFGVAYYEKNKRLVTDLMKKYQEGDYDYFYACGPKPMLKAVNNFAKTEGEVSLEERMACGMGQCKCCSIETNDGMKTVCHDGPVLKNTLVRWCDHE